MANNENKIILEFPATNVEIEFGETITFDNISGFLDSGRVTYNGESLTEEIAHLEDGKADQTYVDTELDKKADKSNTYTKSEVDTLIDNLPEPMIFKGTLGVGGTIQALPAASASNEGWTYKVITDGTYAGQTAKVGDVFTSNGSAWVLIPSGDEDNDTWRAIKVEGVEVLGNGTSSGAVDFVGSDNIEIEYDGDGKIKTKTKNIYTKEEVDDIVYNILPDNTASGSVANFETDLALPLKSLEVDVNAVQDLHGYDNPWVGGAGKNLLPPIETVTRNGITFSQSGDYININGTATSNAYVYLFDGTLPAGNYVVNRMSGESNTAWRVGRKIGDDGWAYFAGEPKPITLTEESRVMVALFAYPSHGEFSNLRVQYQLEKGTTPTSWTPYENICPITGHDEVNIYHSGEDTSNPDEITITLGQTVFGGTINLTTGLLRITKGYVEYDGSSDENWVLNSINVTNNWARFAINVPDAIVVENSDTQTRCFSNIFVATNANTIVQTVNTNKIAIISTQRLLISVPYTTCSSVAELRAWLSSNNLQVVYELATPIEVDLTPTEVDALVGTNNIWADTGDTEVVFKSSVNDYVSAHSGGNLLGMGGVYLGGAKSGGSEEDTDEGEDTEKVKLDETKVEVKTIGDTKKLGGE